MTVPTTVSPRRTLAELAVAFAGASRVFQRHGLDFCCNGRVSLAEACAKRGLDAQELIAELEREAPTGDAAFTRWDERPVDDLVDHLLVRYHPPLREELPRLVAMARKVEAVHGDKPSCPRGLGAELDQLATELELHMQKEEQVLFPLIRAGQGRTATMPVQVMEAEHRDVGAALQRIRGLTSDFVAPPEACNTWKALYLGVRELERELMEHMSLENNVLFPRALCCDAPRS